LLTVVEMSWNEVNVVIEMPLDDVSRLMNS